MKTIVKRLALMLCCAGLFLASCSDDEASDAQRTLMEVIREAETLVAEVEEGTSEGDIAPGSKKILQAWIDQAYFIMNNTSREEGETARRGHRGLQREYRQTGYPAFRSGVEDEPGSFVRLGTGGCLHRGDAGPLLGVRSGRPVHRLQRIGRRRLHGPQQRRSTSTMPTSTTGTAADAARSNSARGTTSRRPMRRETRWSSTSTANR